MSINNTAAFESTSQERTYWSDLLNEVVNKMANRRFAFISSLARKKLKSKNNLICNKRTWPKQSYSLGQKFNNIKFTRREAECMLLMLSGTFRVKDIARILNLSPRTIEDYIANMRIKLQCHNKYELISIIAESDFLSNVDFSLAIEKKHNRDLE